MVKCIRYYAILYGIQTFPDFGKVSDSCLAVMSTCMCHLSNISVNLVFMLLPVNSASPQPMATFLRSTKTQRYRMLIPPRMFFPVSFYTDICLKQTLNRHCLTNSLPLRFPVHSDCSSLCHLQPEMTISGVSKESQDQGTFPHAFSMPAFPAMLSAVTIIHLLPSWRVFLEQQVPIINPSHNSAGQGMVQ